MRVGEVIRGRLIYKAGRLFKQGQLLEPGALIQARVVCMMRLSNVVITITGCYMYDGKPAHHLSHLYDGKPAHH